MSDGADLCHQCREIVAMWLRSTAGDVEHGNTADDDLLLSCPTDGLRTYRFCE